ncbi:TolC family protein, partial [Vibrio parahaemolyticus]|nr:TolC family protein [Vibrio parahaemolyticus]
MKWTRANAICFGVLAVSPAFGQTLEQAVENTLISNPDIKSAFNEFVSKRYVNEASSGAYLPSVDLDAGVGYEGINPAESNRKSTDLTRKEATIT